MFRPVSSLSVGRYKMGGFRELAALAPNGVNGVGTSDALLPAGQLRSLGKRRRTGVAQMHASGSETFESLRGAYEVSLIPMQWCLEVSLTEPRAAALKSLFHQHRRVSCVLWLLLKS